MLSLFSCADSRVNPGRDVPRDDLSPVSSHTPLPRLQAEWSRAHCPPPPAHAHHALHHRHLQESAAAVYNGEWLVIVRIAAEVLDLCSLYFVAMVSFSWF